MIEPTLRRRWQTSAIVHGCMTYVSKNGG